MRRGNSPRSQVLHDARVRQGVEITAHYYGDPWHSRDGGLEPDPSLRLSLHDNVVELVGKHECLDELHVCKLWVPVDVSVGYQDVLAGHVEGTGVFHFQ